jgi:hypothetical protein
MVLKPLIKVITAHWFQGKSHLKIKSMVDLDLLCKILIYLVNSKSI